MQATVMILLAVISGTTNSSVASDLGKQCADQSSYTADDRIASCSALLGHRYLSNSDRAETLYNRGVAYNEKRLWDQAILDYTEALKLRPD